MGCITSNLCKHDWLGIWHVCCISPACTFCWANTHDLAEKQRFKGPDRDPGNLEQPSLVGACVEHEGRVGRILALGVAEDAMVRWAEGGDSDFIPLGRLRRVSEAEGEAARTLCSKNKWSSSYAPEKKP